MPKHLPDRGDEVFVPGQGAISRPKAERGGRRKTKRKGQGGETRAELPDDGVVRVSRERRRGKGVTLVSGAPVGEKELSKLGKQLKQRCGSGGTTKDGVIEIQGDHRDVVVEQLQALGWTVKRVGG